MYGFLTNALKRRLIYDFRELMNQHPEFKDKIQVLPRFPLKDRPQLFLHLTGNTANLQRLSPDNHLGTVESYVQLLFMQNTPSSSIEWIKEDGEHLDQLVHPGIYYVTIVDQTHFTVEPLYEIKEQLYRSYQTGRDDPNFQTQSAPIRGNVDVIAGEEHGDSVFLLEGTEYILDQITGRGKILADFGPPGWGISIRYWTPAEVLGPFELTPLTVNAAAIPGVVLAFGRRVVVGDQQAVRVYSKRELVAKAIGGKWELTVDLDMWALDPDSCSEVVDFLALAMWSELFDRYTTEGIAVSKFDIGGESEEVYDPNTEQTWFMLNTSFSALCDWELHVPYPYQLSAIRGLTIPAPGYSEGRTIVPTLKPLLVSHSFDYERIH